MEAARCHRYGFGRHRAPPGAGSRYAEHVRHSPWGAIGAGGFALWLNERREVPRPTVFIKGNHEDFVWLDAQEDDQVLPGLTYLHNGQSVDLRDPRSGTIRVAGVGGCYGPSNYGRRSDELQGYAKRHYTSDEIERLANADGVDIVLTHDAPAGVRFNRHRRGAGYTSEAQGLDVLLTQLRPRVCFFGHHHTRVDAEGLGGPLRRAQQGRNAR
jgi:Icc-related predicted phosphoesterase